MIESRTHRSRRFPVSRKGELTYGSHRVKCLVQDISEKGLLIVCNYEAEIGLELTVEFDLQPELEFLAKIKVTHSDDGCFGAEIIDVDPRSESNWKQFLEARYSASLKRPRKRLRE